MKNNILLAMIALLYICSLKLYANKPTLLIKIPTRQRPHQFFKVLDKYYKELSNQVPYLFVISCDKEDQSMNNAQVKERLNAYPNLFYYYNSNRSKVEAYNNDIEKHVKDCDILLITSDDTRPCHHYDLIIANIMMNNFPNFDGVINFNDGHVNRVLNTFPVVGTNYYKMFHYIYHPSYKSLWCDNEFTFVSQHLKRECYTDQIIIEHLHPAWGTASNDQLYQRNESFNLVDKKNFELRQSRHFDIHLISQH